MASDGNKTDSDSDSFIIVIIIIIVVVFFFFISYVTSYHLLNSVLYYIMLGIWYDVKYDMI